MKKLTAIFMFFFGFLFGKKMAEQSQESQQDKKMDPVEANNELLLSANLKLRKGTIEIDVMTQTEVLIDTLSSVSERINHDFPNDSLTWQINRMVSEYLPNKVINPFLALNAASQKDNNIKTRYLESISTLQKEAEEVGKLVSGRQQGEFERKAEFIQKRFEK